MGAGKRVLAGITIGQTPRVDITADVTGLLGPDVELREYGALDGLSLEEVQASYHPAPGDELLVSRMRDGSQAQMTQSFVIPRVQACIDQAQDEGADVIVLYCTGVFPAFRHRGIFIEPQPLLHSTVRCLADGRRVGVLVPTQAQVAQAYEFWGASGVDVTVAWASPYLAFDEVVRVGRELASQDVAFVCSDCMGYSLAMKRAIEEAGAAKVLLPRTLATRVACEFLS